MWVGLGWVQKFWVGLGWVLKKWPMANLLCSQLVHWILGYNPLATFTPPGNYPVEKIPPELTPAECSNILKANI